MKNLISKKTAQLLEKYIEDEYNHCDFNKEKKSLRICDKNNNELYFY